MKVKTKLVKKEPKSREAPRERMKSQLREKSQKTLKNDRNRRLNNSELSKNNKTEMSIEGKKNLKEFNANKTTYRSLLDRAALLFTFF